MNKVFFYSLSLFLLVSCGAKDPLTSLSEGQRLFLLGDDESKITFMGWPNDKGEPSCNPNRMNQAYAFLIDGDKLLIESVRPSGSVRHNIKEIIASPDSIEIKAKNGADIPFSLKFTRISDGAAYISFDGEADSEFIRCAR